MTTIPAYTVGGITRPALVLDSQGNIVLDDAASTFAASYGLKALYLGCPPGTPWPPVHGSISTPVDANAGANSVAEGAAAGTTVGVTASATSVIGPVTYSLVGDSSGGGFKINATTGVVTVNDPTKIDFESAPGHAYTISVRASDGILSSTQSFAINVTDVAPSAPIDNDAGANSVTEGAAAGTAVGITAHATDVNGGAVTYSLTGDTSGGGFKIDPHTGVVTVNDATKIDYESSGPSHAHSITVQASDGTLTSSQTFTIGVNDATIGAPTDTNAAANQVTEGAAAGTTVGITASAIDPNGPASTYSLIGDTSGGGFTINAATGVVTVADPTKIDFESSGAGHSYNITVQAVNGAATTQQTFTIAVNDVAPSAPVDSNAATNQVSEGAAAGTTVGITASATDINGPAVTYSLIGDTSGGGFTINAATGVITVADPSKIDYESSGPTHSYTVTAQASDGTLATSQTFTIAVADVAPSTPSDNDATANSVAEGAAAGNAVGITAHSTDINGGLVTYSLIGDTSGGGFTINAATGIVTVADPTKIDFESSGPTHSYTITAQASDGTLATSQTFTIAVNDVAPSAPVDADVSTNTIAEGAANGSTVGVTASSTDVNGPAVTYSLVGDTSGGGFTINAATGVITVADSTKIDFETSGPTHSYTVTAQASDGLLASSQTFTIAVSDVAPTTPLDSDGGPNQVSMNAPVGTYAGITASSIDVNGPAVTYSLVGDTSGGGFTINATTGQVLVADSTKIPYNPGSPTFDITVDASDGTLHSQQTFTINIVPNTPPVANDDALSATEAGGANNAVAGSNPSGNVILGTGSAGAVQDTDAEDASSALTVVAVHTGAEGASTGTGAVNSPLIGSHGTLTLNTNGSYTYTVNQNDAQVQALHTSADTITDKFNYTIQDTGGLQDTATITFTIHGADDLPVAVADTGSMTEDDAPTSFNVIANDSQDPDSTAANTITLGAGGITVTGPAGETFANTDATASIVSNQIQVTLNNAHFQQLALGEHATVTVPYTLTGDAGETSSASLVVTVNGVNDVPVAVDDSGSMTEDQSGHAFTVLTNDTLDADHGAPNTVTTGAIQNLVSPSGENIDTTDVSVGVNGSSQIVVNLGSDFQHMQDGQTTTFDIPYTLHGDQAGDTSTATLHVTVTGVNDAPVASNFTFNLANSATANTDLVVNDPTDGAPDPAGPQKTISASILSGASDVDGPGPLVVVAGTIATAHGGSVTMQSDGDFIYKPPVGYTGSDSFTYQVSDQNAGPSGVGLATGTITINVAAPKVWYVNADAATDGDGSSENPFNSLSHFNGAGGVDGAGDTIFLETASGHYTAPAGGLQLENGEQLISQSAGLVVPDGSGGAGTVTLVSASGANAAIDGGVILGSGNNIQGVDFGSSSTFALSGANVGTSTINNIKSGVINNTGTGGAISITGSGNALTYDFSSVTSSGGTNGVVINGASGTVHAHGGAISGASGSDVSLSSGTLNFTYDGTISDNTGSTVSIASMSGGTQAFTGAISSSGGTGISLTSDTGATMNFSGGINLSTGASNAFTATGGGTVNVTGTNHLTTTTGTALNITNTTIGSSNVTFHDINSTGSSNNAAIILDTTGSSGGLIVQGTGSTAGSGGTISNKTGADINSVNSDGTFTLSGTNGTGIYLNNTSNVSLNGMSLNDFSNFAIVGNNVSGLTLNHTNITGTNGDNALVNEGAIALQHLSGTNSVSNSSIGGGLVRNVSAINTNSDNGNITFTNDTIGKDSDSLGSDAMFLQARNTATLNATVTGSTFLGSRGDMIQFDLTDTAQGKLTLTNSTLNNTSPSVTGGGGITLSGGGSATSNVGLSYDIENNTFSGARGDAILVLLQTGAGSATGKIIGNTIGVAGTDKSGSSEASAIEVTTNGRGAQTTDIENNQIHQYSNFGILLQMGNQNVAGSQGTIGDLNATVAGNTIDNPSTFSFNKNGIQVNLGTTSGDTYTAYLDINNNDASNSGSTDSGAGSDYVLRQRMLTTMDLKGYAGANNDNAAVVAFIQAQNIGTETVFASNNVAGGGGGFGNTPGGKPVLPPLLAADGGVAAASPSTGEMHLTQAGLDSVVSAAIAQWAAVGASASQLAQLHSTVFSVADLAGDRIGEESPTTPAHILIDTNAAGHGWFVDPTPSDSSEFTHAANAAGTDLFTDPSTAAAGHLDLLTTVVHEMGHVLGLPDLTTSSDAHDLMYINLVNGERRLPSTADVPHASAASNFSFAAVGASAPTPPAPPAQFSPAAGTHSFLSDLQNFVFSHVDPAAPPAVGALLAKLLGFGQSQTSGGLDGGHTIDWQHTSLSDLFSGHSGAGATVPDSFSQFHVGAFHHDLVV